MISPVLIDRIKYGTYILWCGTNLVFIPLIYFLSKFLHSSYSFERNLSPRIVPETANAALEDIDVLFQTSKTWIIGPGSRRKLRNIVAGREEAENSYIKEKDIAAHKSEVEIIEDNKA
jgi:hypothetical protein